MFEIYRKIFALLDSRERKRFILLMGVMILVALSELIGFSAVLRTPHSSGRAGPNT
jgi:hypothetical protein